MSHSITAIHRIRAAAREAARTHSDARSACPYPLESEHAERFVTEFDLARAEIEAELASSTDSAFCECDLAPTLEELETSRCSCCGKEIIK